MRLTDAAVRRAPFRFSHPLAHAAMLSPEATVALVDRVPDLAVDAFMGDGNPLQTKGTREVGLPKAEVARDIAEGGRADILRVSAVRQLDEYRELLDAAVEPHVAPIIDAEHLTSRSARIFFAGPGAVTEPHLDKFHGFLLQISGTKRLSIARVADPAAEEAELDRAVATGEFGPGQPIVIEHEYDLVPGDGVYIPPCTFHAALVGDATSIAISTVVWTQATDRAIAVRVCNHHMRTRLHLSPRPYGGPFDFAKVLTARARFAMMRRRVRYGLGGA